MSSENQESAPSFNDGSDKENKEPKTAGRVAMGAFGIKKTSNDGVKMPLVLPDGTPTDEFLVVRGADSTKFRNAQAVANRANLKLMKNNKLEPQDLANRQAENQRKLVAALVVDWSFDDEFNETNLCKLFFDAPYIQEQVDAFAGNRKNFFVKPPQD